MTMQLVYIIQFFGILYTLLTFAIVLESYYDDIKSIYARLGSLVSRSRRAPSADRRQASLDIQYRQAS